MRRPSVRTPSLAVGKPRKRLPARYQFLKRALALVALLGPITIGAGFLSSARSQEVYPSKPIRVIVPWPAGGGTDIIARKLAQGLEKTLGQAFVVDNRGGANGVIGTQALANSPPDGYSIMVSTLTSHASNPVLHPNLPYDSIRDFATLSVVSSVPLVIVVNPATPYHTVVDILKAARAAPNQINYASFGSGSMSHLAGEMLKAMANVKLVHVPYKGGGPALADTVAGHVPIFYSGVNSALPFIKAGTLRPIAVTSAQRSKALPDVPTIAETAGLETYEVTVDTGAWAPAQTPAAIVNKLSQAIIATTKDPEFKGWLEKDGSTAVGNTSEQMKAQITAEIAKLGRIIKAVGLAQQ